jgi:hypothetical protein
MGMYWIGTSYCGCAHTESKQTDWHGGYYTLKHRLLIYYSSISYSLRTKPDWAGLIASTLVLYYPVTHF